MQISWKKRSGPPRTPPNEMFLEPLASVFHGAGLLSGCRYLAWRSRKILERYTVTGEPDRFSYGNLVCHADHMIEDGEFTEQGYELMYYLVLEPLALIQQKRRKEE